jgi:1-deoxy-D-xylulose-5-phosphate synthase
MINPINIRSARELKKLKPKELEKLCGDIREFLINSLSKTGGHLASNLGVVELTVALHAVYDCPFDKIIFDVGHQSYVHKILTGRGKNFGTLRKKGGLSGFPKFSESPSDAFNTGHASTSISAALGYCAARDILGQDYRVVAIIGDGSMTGGLAYEAINNASRANTDLLIILNDNQMSISENVGALSRYLNEVRTAPGYIGAKADVSNLLNRIPMFGRHIKRFIERTKDGIKYLLVPGGIFEELGLVYIGPVDGHNMNDLLSVLNKVKLMKGSVLLHVYTTKGKGYTRAEESPSEFHGVGMFDIETGDPVIKNDSESYSDVFGAEMVRLGAQKKNLCAITAAMPVGTGLSDFANRFPDRFFDVGIAESHAVTFAAGMAKAGAIPVVAVYATFLQRAYDQILHDVCMQNLHVVFAVDRAGVVGQDGETHQGLFDISFLSLPNMTVLAPSNKRELAVMLEYAVGCKGPVAIRYPKCGARAHSGSYKPLVPGEPEIVSQGDGIVLLAVGSMLPLALEVSRLLKPERLPTVVNVRFVYPISEQMLALTAKHRHVFVLEEHVSSGGFGSLLLNAMSKKSIRPETFYDFCLPDAYVEHGGRQEILDTYGLNAKEVYYDILRLIKKAGAN